MATTRDGRRLTEAHRLAQIQLAEGSRIEAGVLLSLLDFGDLADTRPGWQAATLLMLRSRWRQSQTLAALYLSDYRAAETGTSLGPVVELEFPDVTYAAALAAATTVPVGIDPADVAWMQQVERKVLAEVGQAALAGGRSTIDRSSRAHRVRYRRVTDGMPCAFCAMLAGRGPVYSEETAYFRSHEHCGCSAEPVYGRWQPTSLEYKWASAYQDAADQARAAGERVLVPHGRQRKDTVLWRMRRNEPGLFSDGIFPKAA